MSRGKCLRCLFWCNGKYLNCMHTFYYIDVYVLLQAREHRVFNIHAVIIFFFTNNESTPHSCSANSIHNFTSTFRKTFSAEFEEDEEEKNSSAVKITPNFKSPPRNSNSPAVFLECLRIVSPRERE